MLALHIGSIIIMKDIESVTAAVALVLETNMHRGMYGGEQNRYGGKKEEEVHRVRENTAKEEKVYLKFKQHA